MRLVIMAAILALASCGPPQKELTYVDQDMPGWNMNPTRWNETTNKITEPPSLTPPSLARAP